jgi:uncharacterized protein YybS (DUF2232 family)
MTPTRSLVESSLLVALAVALFAAASWIPIAGLAIVFLCPAPLVVLGLSRDVRQAVVGACAATFLVALLMGVVSAVFFSLGFAVLGVGLGILARKFSRGTDVLLGAVLVSLAGKLLLMVVATKLTGVNPFSLDPKVLEETASKVFAFYAARGMSPETLGAMRQQMDSMLRSLPVLFPSFLLMAAAVDAWLSYTVSAGVLRRLGRGTLPPLPRFSQWRFPKNIFWALLASFVLVLLGGREGSPPAILQAGLNLRLLVQLLFLVQGLAVAWAWLESRGRGRLLKGASMVLVLFVPLLSQVAEIVGVVDMWWDLRSRMRRDAR